MKSIHIGISSVVGGEGGPGGVGGVGGYTLEALIRSGIDNIDIYDFDTIDISNINRQVIAVSETVGKSKVDEWVKRAKLINPKININGINMFVDSDSIESIDFSKYNYVVDAIDTVTSKMLLIKKCNELNIPIISSMGTGNKLHPEMLEITDISKTIVCPLARVIRRELRNKGINHLTVVYSKEEPQNIDGERTPASSTFVPISAGVLIASKVVQDILEIK